MTQVKASSLSVGEVAARSGVAISTIHFYESKGLIEGWRSAGNQRRYHRAVLRRIAIIRIAQAAGLPLKVIHAFVAQFAADQVVTAADWQRITASWEQVLSERIRSLTQLRDQLGACIGCGCLSLTDCPLRNPDDALAHRGAGARILLDADLAPRR